MRQLLYVLKKIQEAKVLNAELTHLKSNAVSYYFIKFFSSNSFSCKLENI